MLAWSNRYRETIFIPDEGGSEMPVWEKTWDFNSDSGETYRVSIATDGVTWGCSCPAWKYKRRTCRHILQKQLELTHAELKQMQAKRDKEDEQQPTFQNIPIARRAPIVKPKRDDKYSQDGRYRRRLDLD